MGRHKLPYKLKKPNTHHKYWRYILADDPHRSEISTKTKVKYEAERIAKEAYNQSLLNQQKVITFGTYAQDFFTASCKLTKRKQISSKSVTPEMLKVKRSQLTTHLLPQFKDYPLNEITLVSFEDWRMTLPLANSTKNSITIVMKQILNEAVRDQVISINPLQQVETLSKIASKPRGSLSVEEMKQLFPTNIKDAFKVWDTEYHYALAFLLVSSGMRSGEVRALTWADVIWEDSGILITKAVKNSGTIGTVKEWREKFVRLPFRTIDILKSWKKNSPHKQDHQFIFYGKEPSQPLDRKI
jgi:integrase